MKTRSFIKASLVAFVIAVWPAGGANASGVIETSGTVLSVALPVVAGGLTVSKEDAPGRLQLVQALATTVGVTYGLKYTVHETRPNGGEHSFPSAHTSVSFAAADFIGRRYGWDYGIPAYLAAGYVGYTRVEAKAHYTRDVLAGAAIGILGSALFTTPFGGGGMKVSAMPTGEGVAMRLSCTW
ncbi:MAG: phosphatase PAP2 family protein [Chlorobiaceae bacterium]|nr:phosphatase PAP2 family protein [Chlorobiaceae bacterium]